MDSILTSIKKMLGSTEDCVDFDVDIIMHINSVFSELTQLGVGPSEGFSIEDDDATWDDYTSDNQKLNMVKTYIYLKVRLVFDPPSNSAVLASMERTVDKLEFRLTVEAESK